MDEQCKFCGAAIASGDACASCLCTLPPPPGGEGAGGRVTKGKWESDVPRRGASAWEADEDDE